MTPADLDRIEAEVSKAEKAFAAAPKAVWSTQPYLSPAFTKDLRAAIAHIRTLEAALEKAERGLERIAQPQTHLLDVKRIAREALTALRASREHGSQGGNGS